MGNPRLRPQSIRTRLVITAAALAVMGAIAVDLAARLQSPGHRVAVQIAKGFTHAADPDEDLILDEKLTRDANEAGYRWAERRSLDRLEPCQAGTAAFRQGCESYVREQAR